MASLPPFLQTRRARRLAVAVAVVLALRVALPYALEAGIGWGGERALGVPVSVSNVDLGLLRGRVVVDGLAVAGPGHPPTAEGAIDPGTALLRWERLDLNLGWLDLLRGRLRLSELRLAGPTGRVELDASGAPVLPSPAEEAPPAEEAEETAATPGEADDAPDAPGTAAESPGETAPPEEAAAPAEAPDEDAEAPAEAPDEDADDGGWPILVDHLELTGLDFRLLDGRETPAVSAGLEALRLESVSYDASGLGLGAIGFEAPRLHVRRDFVVAEPVPDEAPDELEPAPTPATTTTATTPPAREPAVHRMEELRIERADFVVLTDAGPFQMALQVDASGVTTARGERFPVDVRLDVGDGVFEIAGDLGLSPPSFLGRVAWTELPLPPLAMLARPDLARWVSSEGASGELAVDLRTEAGPDGPAGLSLRGRVASHALRFAQPDGEDLDLGWQLFEVPIDELAVPLGDGAEDRPVRVALGAVRLVAPHVRYRQPNAALDELAPAAAGDEAPAVEDETPGDDAPAADAAPGPEPEVSIASFELKDGTLAYRDATVTPAYAGKIRDLQASLRDVSLPAGTAGRVALSARLPVRSTLSLQGSHGRRSSRLDLAIERLALPPMSPYAEEAAAYRLEQGDLSLETTAERSGERWDVSNRLTLHQLGLAGTGNGALERLLGIPVDLAMALLRDLEGDIRLGIPVTLDRGELSVGIGSVLRDALRAAIAGAVTSPLKMMGAAFSFAEGGGLAVEPLRMEPGRAVLAPGQEDEIAGLAELVASRPMLAVRLEGGATPEDRDGLAERILIERVAADRDLPDVEDAGFFARRRVRGALEARGRGEPGTLEGDDAALLARYVAAVEVPPERFTALARARAEAVAEALVTGRGLAPGHVRVADETGDRHAGVRIGFEARETPAGADG